MRLPAILVAVAIGIAGCGAFGQSQPEACDGISAEFGGCDPDRPTFAGTTCAEVGTEFGTQFDAEATGIINGPPDEDGKSQAVRMTHLMVLASSLANKHLRDNDMVRECDVEEFLAAAEEEFSEDLRQRAGEFLDDGTQTHSYEEWRTELTNFLTVIDQDEDLPYGSS